MVRALEGISEKDDKAHGGVGDEGEIEVAVGKFVNLIDDEDLGVLHESGFPRGVAPVLVGRELHALLPILAEIDRWGDDAEGLEPGAVGLKELANGGGFPSAGETGDVDQLDAAGRPRVDEAIDGLDLGVIGVGGSGGVKLADDAVVTGLDVGDQVLGTRVVHLVRVDLAERQTVAVFVAECEEIVEGHFGTPERCGGGRGSLRQVGEVAAFRAGVVLEVAELAGGRAVRNGGGVFSVEEDAMGEEVRENG